MPTRLLLVMLLSLPLCASAADPAPGAPPPEALIAQAREELRNLDSLIDAAQNPAVRAEIHRKAARVEQLLAQSQLRIMDLRLPPPPPRPTAPVIACSEADFRDLLAIIQKEGFSEARLRIIREAASTRRFSAEQVRRVIAAMSFGNDKVEAGRLLFPTVVDPQNWFRVYEAIDFDSDKEALRRAVDNQGGSK